MTTHGSEGSRSNEGVTFVVPVRNGARFVHDALESVVAQDDGRPLELIVVDDGSVDESWKLLGEFANSVKSSVSVRLIRRHGGGAAAAINVGIRAAQHPVICQVDQDLRLEPGWLGRLLAVLDDPAVGAVQGYYATDSHSSLCSRVTGLDLEQRYASIAGDTDHVCTGNVAYRTEALRRVGLFDETMGYGYDNDMSYRLLAAGYRLAFCPSARAVHRWREGLKGYLIQQYGFGYGRIDLVAKHRHRFTGDRVSPATMMLHPIVMTLALVAVGASICTAAVGWPMPWLLAIGASLVGTLTIERLWAGGRAVHRFGDQAAWLFPVLHLSRDLAWVAAIVVWSIRRVIGRPRHPSHSMYPRNITSIRRPPLSGHARAQREPTRTIAIIPARNEAANLPSVIMDIKRHRPDIALLVVDDDSHDDTAELMRRLSVASMHFPKRMGIGSAMRAGLRYAARLGYDVAVRLDGDGQHDGADIDALVEPICSGHADVVLGTRFAGTTRASLRQVCGPGAIRLMRVPLAMCLTALTGRRVTDPTSGFCAFGPSAVRLLAEHHPDGYAEPELRLFLSRNRLRVLEVPVRTQSRLSGRTSLTPSRLALAAARLALAMLIVPLRATVREPLA